MGTNARLREIVQPIVEELGLELFDLEFAGGALVIKIERPQVPHGADAPGADAPGEGPPPGVDLAAITAVTRAVSRALDETDPIPGTYALEVSSPGLERPLRIPRHFQRAVGQTVKIKTVPGSSAGRRLSGQLVRAGSGHDPAEGDLTPGSDADAGADSIDLLLDEPAGELRTVPYAEIDKARTVFEWGPEPRPVKPPPPTKGGKAAPGAARGKAASAAKGAKSTKGSTATPTTKDHRPAGDPADEKKVSAT